ncbi:DNA/RNA endonuclease, partial [bacterium]|nr:DNA/RNA endonuclease [bacterium]
MKMKESIRKSTIVTYKVTSDIDGKLKTAGRTACNFWNSFVQPGSDIVIRLGTFTDPDPSSGTIAQAWTPYSRKGVLYGRVEFNTRYLGTFRAYEVAGTVVHELGHTLGIG